MTISGRSALLLLAAALGISCDNDPTTGALVVTVNGLPATAPAAVEVTGPNQFSRILQATATLENLPPGEYAVRARVVTFSHAPFTSAIEATTHQVSAGGTASATVDYALTGGSIDLAVAGLPSGASPRLRLSGPDLQRDVSAAGIIEALPAGTYVIRIDTTQNADGDRFASQAPSLTLIIHPSLTAIPATVTYAAASGTLALSITGLPPGSDPAPVTVAGPAGFLRRLSASTTIRGLYPGTYSIAAATHHEACPLIYTPAQAEQLLDIAIGAVENRAVGYSEQSLPPQTMNLRIDAVHLIQVTQDLAGAVPLLAGREALLRVYGTASEANSVRPRVRVTLSTGGVKSLEASEASVRRTAEPGIIAASWNVVVPGSDVTSGLTVLAEIDPDNRICESDESDNRFPATGVSAVDVRDAPIVGIRFVPVRMSSGFTGGINGDNVDDFLAYARKVHPVAEYDAEIRFVPYSTTRADFQPSDQNGSWSGVISEVGALRVAEGSARYYHGIVRVNYSSGIAGLGLLGGKTALTWDRLPGATEVVAHELGHNYARFHAPCGNPGGPDSQYPQTGDYAGGKIGQVGYDAAERVLKLPTVFADYMSYCDPTWTSDYTYKGILDWISSPARGPTLPLVAQRAPEPSLLVWGRIVDGVPILEPAFELITRPSLPLASGPHRVSATDAAGAEILSIPFTAEPIADLPNEARAFAFAVPVSMFRGRTPASLSLRSGDRTARNVAVSGSAADPAVTAARIDARTARLRWDAARFPMALVRDPATGDILSFARGGEVTVETARGEIEVDFSTNVRSVRRRVPVR